MTGRAAGLNLPEWHCKHCKKPGLRDERHAEVRLPTVEFELCMECWDMFAAVGVSGLIR